MSEYSPQELEGRVCSSLNFYSCKSLDKKANSGVLYSLCNSLSNHVTDSVLSHPTVMVVEAIFAENHSSLQIVCQPDRTLERRTESAAPGYILDE